MHTTSYSSVSLFLIPDHLQGLTFIWQQQQHAPGPDQQTSSSSVYTSSYPFVSLSLHS